MLPYTLHHTRLEFPTAGADSLIPAKAGAGTDRIGLAAPLPHARDDGLDLGRNSIFPCMRRPEPLSFAKSSLDMRAIRHFEHSIGLIKPSKLPVKGRLRISLGLTHVCWSSHSRSICIPAGQPEIGPRLSSSARSLSS
ncbi:hypothetical protein VTG60DRAFT_4054 [Thermothelomyces hinnuleus]